MIILSIDPSIVETGWAILSKGEILDAGTIKTNSKDTLEKRLYEIQLDIISLCRLHQPSILAIETQYLDYGKINNSVLKTVETKGIIEGAFWGVRQQGRIVEVHPMEVKSFIGMTGRIRREDAKKCSVNYVQRHYSYLGKINHNISDAVIIGLVAYNTLKYDYKITGRTT